MTVLLQCEPSKAGPQGQRKTSKLTSLVQEQEALVRENDLRKPRVLSGLL